MAKTRQEWPDSRMVLVSTLVLIQEAALAGVVYLVHRQTQESPNTPGNFGLALVLLGPWLLVVAIAVIGMATLFLVLPSVSLSHRLGRRFGGREVWWWVPPVTAGAALLPFAAAVPAGELEPYVALWAWPPTTVALVAAALITRLPARRLARWVAIWGTAAVLATAVFGPIALSAGLIEEYRPPRLTRAALTGVWSDGRGGTLAFTPDGTVTASRIEHRPYSSNGDENVQKCSGQGTWRLDPGRDTWTQQIEDGIRSCPWGHWNIGGTEGRVTLYQYIGDPDSWTLYELRRVPFDS
ncbi:hypothetical protein ACFV7Q_33275 [Streptomyces sp. NPDC059851]|uniref:hypothetical protein n=1 Tax=Streptomyces sp. NPDC059851 TaxID=3346971 RepID=UPI00365B39A3